MPEYPRSPFEKTGTSITPKIDSNALDATVIGGTTPAAGTFGNTTNYSKFLSDGKLHFDGGARPVIFDAITGAQLNPSHSNPLCITSLHASDGILTSGLNTAAGATRRIEVQGIDGGLHVKGRLKAAYSQGDTTHSSQLIKIKLNTTNATWEQATGWKIILDIANGCFVGGFTVFMPAFSMMEYSDYIVYVASDGTTYLDNGQMGFFLSLAGSSAATENFSNNESAGSDVVIEVADTTGFYVGNQTFISDSANSEWVSIKSIVTNTSITVRELTNSYTTANGAKFDIFDYTQSADTFPTQRGLLKLKILRTGINSAFEFQYAIPHDIDDSTELNIVIQYAGTTTNPGSDVSKWRVQWILYPLFSPVTESIQYGNLVYSDVTPPSTLVSTIATVATIAGVDHAGKHVLAVEISRIGTDAGDTYAGDVKIVGIAMTRTIDKLGYEV